MNRTATTAAVAAVLALATPAGAGPSVSPWPRLHRSLHLPHWAPGRPCPKSPGRRASEFSPYGSAYALGRGPVYPVIGVDRFDPNAATGAVPFVRNVEGWASFKVLWISSSANRGPILVRGRRLDNRPLLRLSGFSRELRFRGGPGWNEGWRDFPSDTYVREPGCYGYQVDGLTFSRVMVIRVAR